MPEGPFASIPDGWDKPDVGTAFIAHGIFYGCWIPEPIMKCTELSPRRQTHLRSITEICG